MYKSGFKTMFYKLMERLKTEGTLPVDLTFHGLRSAMATNLADAGCTPYEIIAITGHASISSVEKYVKKSITNRRKWQCVN
ncbi:MAG: tyrosine-type recombinase/integrase [Sneathiella sp.]